MNSIDYGVISCLCTCSTAKPTVLQKGVSSFKSVLGGENVNGLLPDV